MIASLNWPEAIAVSIITLAVCGVFSFILYSILKDPK